MKRFRTGSIYFRLFRSYLASSLIPVLCLALLTVLFTREYSMNKMKDEMSLMTRGMSGVLQQTLENYEENLELFAGYEEVGDFIRDKYPTEDEIIQLNQKMYLITGGRMDSVYLHLITPEGNIIHSTTGQTGVPRNVYSYWGILRKLQNSDGPILYSGVYGTDESGLTLAVPVRKGENTIGYAMLCITESMFSDLLDSHSSQQPMEYFLVDSNHYLILDTVTGSEEVFLPIAYRGVMKPGECAAFDNGGDQKLIATHRVDGTDLTLAAVMSVGLVVSSVRSLTIFVVSVCIAAFVIAMLTSRKLAKSVVQPIRIICDTIQSIEDGDRNSRVPALEEDELGTLAKGFNMMLDQLQEQYRTNMERQNRLRIAEFKNLQAQISPHFLYNTLESIKYLARLGMNEEIETVVSKLGILLRSGMNFKRDMIPLREELRVVESYIAIQQVRYEGKFTYSASIAPELLDCMVPNLVIQPLVENAVVHGIEAKVGTGELRLTGWQEEDHIYIEIYDNGDGIPEDKLHRILRAEQPEEEITERERIGMANVHRRLQLYFGEPYGLTVESQPGEYTRIRLRIPIIRGSEKHV